MTDNLRMMKSTWVCRSEALTESAGGEIAATLRAGDLIHLRGELGAGKTQLVRAMAARLGADPLEVTSPTFNIVHEYDTKSGLTIIHIDCYRLSEVEREWQQIGLPELLASRSSIKFVEWPRERLSEIAAPDVEILISVDVDGGRRIAVDRR